MARSVLINLENYDSCSAWPGFVPGMAGRQQPKTGGYKMAFSEEAKDLIFRHAGGKCERCGKQLARNNHLEGEWGAWEAHHKTAVKSDGSDAPSNGEALCLDCHKKTRTYGG